MSIFGGGIVVGDIPRVVLYVTEGTYWSVGRVWEGTRRYAAMTTD